MSTISDARHSLAENPIHRVVISRLAAVWVALSLVLGGIAYYFEQAKIDDFVVALAGSEAERIGELAPPLAGTESPSALAALQDKASALASDRFVVATVRAPNGKVLASAANPRYPLLEKELAATAASIGAEPQRQRLHLQNLALVRITEPLRGADGKLRGYFEGVFVVDAATMQKLRADLVRALAVTLVAVLLTTIALYPVILALNRQVLAFSREVVAGNLELASVLGAAVAKRDSATNAHNYRVTLYSIALGEAVGVDSAAMRALILGAFLHDVGKIGISDRILLKAASLDHGEFEVMRTHVSLGLDILKKSTWLHEALDVVGYHHEKLDGSGYPNGLKGEAIPLNARIFAIADVFDALTSERPYKKAMPCDDAIAILRTEAGKHFDAALAQRFCAMAPALFRRYSGAGEDELDGLLRRKGMHYFFVESQF